MGVANSAGNWEADIGTFLVDRISSDNDSKMMNLTTRDFSKKLNQPLPFSLAFDENTPLETIVSTMASGGGVPPSQTNLPLTGVNTEEPRSFNQGANRWSGMKEVANSNGYTLYFDQSGILQMEAFTDPYLDPPQYAFQVGVFLLALLRKFLLPLFVSVVRCCQFDLSY